METKHYPNEDVNESTTNTNTTTGACVQENLAEMVSNLKADDQNSPGVLLPEPSKFRNIGWTTEEVSIYQIQHFNLIDDYYLPTESDKPLVVKTPDGYFCLDGWDLIEDAKSNGAASIVVDVDNMGEHSDTELCIRKMTLRMKTRGEARYAEIIRNTRDTYELILSSGESDLIVFSHGGRRDRVTLEGNRENDAAEILARRMRKDRDTVQKHKLHCKYLSDEALGFLIENDAKKKFFEDVQIKKRKLITKLTGDEKSTIEIRSAVSEFIIEEFKKATSEKTEKRSDTPVPPATSDADTTDDEVLNDDEPFEDCEGDDPDTEKTSFASPESASMDTDGSITVDAIKVQVKGVARRIEDEIERAMSLDEIKQRLKNELTVIMGILARIESHAVEEK